jgi:hypothetical protein
MNNLINQDTHTPARRAWLRTLQAGDSIGWDIISVALLGLAVVLACYL